MNPTPPGRPLHVVTKSNTCRLLALFCCSWLLSGCSGKQSAEKPEVVAGAAATTVAGNEEAPPQLEVAIAPPAAIEITAVGLEAAQLTPEQLDAGWVSLFDGISLFGWLRVGQADWSVDEGVIRVTRGERSYLCTSFEMSDYELQVDFRSDAKTNSGVFLRTGPVPQDVATECLELNIAPPDNPFPTGSFVQRQKLEPSDLGEFDATEWHTYFVRLEGNHVTVQLDGKQILDFEDEQLLPSGHISLQHNEGRVEFRNVLLRPIHPQPLAVDKDWEQSWTKSQKDDATFSVEPVEEGLKLVGGLGQLQSKQQFDNFFLHARYTLANPDVNSGIFFRCIADRLLDGYECQVNHSLIDGDPLRPADGGAGAIFRRQDARVVLGLGTEPTHIALLASGPQIVTWVNGVQVTDFLDAREPDENPRKGLRTAAGPISLQAHDPTTEVVFHEVAVSSL